MEAIDISLSGFRKDRSLRHRTGIVYPNQHVTADKEVRKCARGAKAEIMFVKISTLKFRSLTTYIYMSYRSANLQTLHFKYLFNKYIYTECFKHDA